MIAITPDLKQGLLLVMGVIYAMDNRRQAEKETPLLCSSHKEGGCRRLASSLRQRLSRYRGLKKYHAELASALIKASIEERASLMKILTRIDLGQVEVGRLRRSGSAPSLATKESS